MPRKPKHPPKVEWDAYWALMNQLQGIDGLGAAMPIPRPLPPESMPLDDMDELFGGPAPPQYGAPMQRPDSDLADPFYGVQDPPSVEEMDAAMAQPAPVQPQGGQGVYNPAWQGSDTHRISGNPARYPGMYQRRGMDGGDVSADRAQMMRNVLGQGNGPVSKAEIERLRRINEQRARAQQ